MRPPLLCVMAFVCILPCATSRARTSGYVPFEDSPVWKPPTKLPARPGEQAPDISLLDIGSSRSLSLSEFEGRVVYLDFWATWCPSCLPLMEKAEKLAGERRSEWKDKVEIVGVSLDKTDRIPRNFARENGWKSLRLLWSPPDLAGREALASKAYGIIELPYAVLINTSGTVVWRGNPARTSPEELIADQLRQSATPAL